MKRSIWITALFMAWALGVQAESPFESFSGVLPPDQKATTFFMYLKAPKRLNFKVSDSKGDPLPDVQVVEVNLTSANTVSIKNPNGVSDADLPEAGIYEVKVAGKAATNSPLSFNLKIADLGPSSAAPPSTPPSPTPETAAAPVSTETEKIPVLNLPSQPTTPTAASFSLAPASETPVVSVASPTVPPSPPPVPPTPVPTQTAAPTTTKTETARETTPVDEPFACVEKFPQGTGYADPYKPIEFKYSRDLPAGTVIPHLVKVLLLTADGKEETVEGQAFPLGKDGVRFIPTHLQPGSVYHVVVLHPRTLKKLDEFQFALVPELMISVAEEPNGFQLDLDMKPITNLIPSPDSQVIRLDHGTIVISGDNRELYTFPLSPALAPTGNMDGISYSGRPFHFTLKIPREKLAGATGSLQAKVLVPLIGQKDPVEIAKASLTKVTAAPVVASDTIASPPEAFRLDSPPPLLATTTATASPSVTAFETASPTITEKPIVVTTPASESVNIASGPVVTRPPIQLKPVIPMPDPGLKATVTWEKKILVSENKDPNAVSWPKGVAWARDGALWVVDSQNRRILSFTEDGDLITAFGKKGKRVGFLGLPIDVAITEKYVAVSDTAAHCIHLYEPSGISIRDIGTWGVKPGQLDLPHSLSLAMDQLWVVDRGNGRVERFGFDGSYKGGFGKKGELSGYLNKPLAMRIFGDTVWTLDGDQGNRIQKFTPDGKLLGSFLEKGLKETTAFELDPWGYPWIADGEGHRVYRMDNNGRVLVTLESPTGQKPWIPTSIAVRADGLVAIGDGISRSIHLYRMKPLP